MLGDTTCQHPNCDADAEDTYTGPNSNTLRLCERHYYNAVTDEAAPALTRANDTDDDPITPFWDSGIRCDERDTIWSDVLNREQPGYNEIANELIDRHRRDGMRGL